MGPSGSGLKSSAENPKQHSKESRRCSGVPELQRETRKGVKPCARDYGAFGAGGVNGYVTTCTTCCGMCT